MRHTDQLVTSTAINNESFFHLLEDTFTKDKIRKHLSDYNDVITEDDIKNISTDIFKPVVYSMGSTIK